MQECDLCEAKHLIPCPTGQCCLKGRWWFNTRAERWRRSWLSKRYMSCIQIKLSDGRLVFKEGLWDGSERICCSQGPSGWGRGELGECWVCARRDTGLGGGLGGRRTGLSYERNLDDFVDWSDRNKMTFNSAGCKVMQSFVR